MRFKLHVERSHRVSNHPTFGSSWTWHLSYFRRPLFTISLKVRSSAPGTPDMAWQNRCRSQLHLCFEHTYEVKDRVATWSMHIHLTWMRKDYRVESVRIIIATDVLISERSGALSCVADGFHRCGSNHPLAAPICVTRYPIHPRAWRVDGKGRGKSVHGNM